MLVGAVARAAGAAGVGLVLAGGGGGGGAVVVLVVGLVEARPLEDDAGTGPQQAMDLAVALRTAGERGGRDGLELLEVAAFLAFVFVCRHFRFLRKRAEEYSCPPPGARPQLRIVAEDGRLAERPRAELIKWWDESGGDRRRSG